jgi:SAM-dependent methyltransferase
MSTPEAHTEAQKFFDHIADDYTARSRREVFNVSSLSFARRQETVIRRLAETPRGGTVLDYGMGAAVFGPASVERGLHYVGLDISPRMIELAKAMNLPGAEYHLGDLELLKNFTATADTVLLIGLIDYLDDPAAGLRALASTVKPGGRLIMSFRNHRSLPRWLRNTSKEIWRALKGRGRSDVDTTAFSAPVLENSFVPQRDFFPVLRESGFREFTVDYLDAAPVFWNMPLPESVWHLWKQADAAVSSPATSFLCASGLLTASAKV